MLTSSNDWNLLLIRAKGKISLVTFFCEEVKNWSATMMQRKGLKEKVVTTCLMHDYTMLP